MSNIKKQRAIKAKENLDIKGNQYKNIYESSKDAIMILEPPSWKFTAGNPSAVKLFGGKNEAEFLKNTPEDLSPKSQPDGKSSKIKAREMINLAMTKGDAFFDWKHKKMNKKEFHAKVLLTKFQKCRKYVLQATVRDITKEVELTEKIIKNTKELEKFNAFAVDRELKMIELKKRIKELEKLLKNK
ncbi:MAG: hypothetical protein U9R34_05590 [Nanoarchaeota archaeon]|nr:hypothetical protein [Nanoarchaeota archaeon]